MTCSEQSLPPVRRCTKTEFRAWLARVEPGEQLKYHRGHLVWDRSPASGLTKDTRRALAGVADAALKAAEGGLVQLVQRRHGPFDFSYLAIKAARSRNRRTARAPVIDRAAAQHSTLCSEAA